MNNMPEKFIPRKYLTREENRQISIFKRSIKNAKSREELETYKNAIERIHLQMLKRIKDDKPAEKQEKIHS
jgi:hypothetical protein